MPENHLPQEPQDHAAVPRGGFSLHQRRLAEAARDAQLRWVLQELAVDCVLDVGANAGQFGAAVRALGFTGRLVSFEPAAAPRRELEAAAAPDAAWEVRPYALGEQEGSAVLHALDAESELGSLRTASAFGRGWKALMADTRDETVAVHRLDEVWDEVVAGRSRVLLKLDTQGFDLPAFRGAGVHVQRGGAVLALLSEVACLPIYDDVPLMAEQLDVYARAGWALAGLHPVSFDVPTLRVVELDALLVRGPAAG